MKLSSIEHTVDLSLEQLVAELVEARATLEAQKQAVWYLERAASEAVLHRPISYDYNILAQLREITCPGDLVGYTPQRDVTTTEPERWNMTQAKPLAKLSSDHADIIEDAKILGQPKIRFAEKKGN